MLRINYKTKVKELWKINELWAGGPDRIDSVYIRRMDYTIIMFYGTINVFFIVSTTSLKLSIKLFIFNN